MSKSLPATAGGPRRCDGNSGVASHAGKAVPNGAAAVSQSVPVTKAIDPPAQTRGVYRRTARQQTSPYLEALHTARSIRGPAAPLTDARPMRQQNQAQPPTVLDTRDEDWRHHPQVRLSQRGRFSSPRSPTCMLTMPPASHSRRRRAPTPRLVDTTTNRRPSAAPGPAARTHPLAGPTCDHIRPVHNNAIMQPAVAAARCTTTTDRPKEHDRERSR